jgi:hypothetical protein
VNATPALHPHPRNPTTPRPVQADLSGLIASPSLNQDDPAGLIPWRIDNKYYTADVHFRLQELLHDTPVSAEDIGVVLYLFENSVSGAPFCCSHRVHSHGSAHRMACRSEAVSRADPHSRQIPFPPSSPG